MFKKACKIKIRHVQVSHKVDENNIGAPKKRMELCQLSNFAISIAFKSDKDKQLERAMNQIKNWKSDKYTGSNPILLSQFYKNSLISNQKLFFILYREKSS